MGGATVAPLTEVGVLLDLMSSMTGASTLLDTALRSFRSPDLLTSMGGTQGGLLASLCRR